MASSLRFSRQTVLIIFAFGATYFVWGTTYIAILFGLKGFGPFLLSSIRFSVSGGILIIYCLVKRKKMPKGRDLRITVVSGVIMLVGGTSMITWSEQYIHSGQVAVIIATEPFLFILLDKKRWSFYFSQKFIIGGLILGFTGIVLFLSFGATRSDVDGISVRDHWVGVSVLLGSAVAWVVGSLYSKKNKGLFNSDNFNFSDSINMRGYFL